MEKALLKFSFFFFLLFRAAPVARGPVRAAAVGLCHSPTMWDLSHFCNLHHSWWQRWILNPLSDAKDWTCILRDTGWVHNPASHNGNSLFWEFFKYLCGLPRNRAVWKPLNYWDSGPELREYLSYFYINGKPKADSRSRCWLKEGSFFNTNPFVKLE